MCGMVAFAMFIAHLPAGYLLTRFMQRKLGTTKYLWVGLVGSVLPDIDMLYFYLVDDRQTLHHHYWTHIPFLWFCFAILLAAAALMTRHRRTVAAAGLVFLANIFIHLVLDTIVGGIAWLYPFFPLYDSDLTLVTVPATHDLWIWSFVFHWTFLLELLLLTLAIALFVRDHRRVRSTL